MTTEQLHAASRRFPQSMIESKQGADYIEHSVIGQRLLEVFGFYEIVRIEPIRGYVPPWEGKNPKPALENAVTGVVMTMRLHTDDGPRDITEIGEVEFPHNHTTDASRMKHATSDAIKRCAMRPGIGLQLWAQSRYYLDKAMDKRLSDEEDAADAIEQVEVDPDDQSRAPDQVPTSEDRPVTEPAQDVPEGDSDADEPTEVAQEPSEEPVQDAADDGHADSSDEDEGAPGSDEPPAPDPEWKKQADMREQELRDVLVKLPEAFVETQDVAKMVEFARPDDQLLVKALETIQSRLAQWREGQPDDTDEGPPPRGYVWHRGNGWYDLYDSDMEFVERIRGAEDVPAAYVPLPSDPQAEDEQDDAPPEEPPIEVVDDDEWPNEVRIYDLRFMVPDRDYYVGGVQEGRKRAHTFADQLLTLDEAFARHLDSEGILGKSIQFAAVSQENLDKLNERLGIRYQTWTEEQA